jgi:hypothetical protein
VTRLLRVVFATLVALLCAACSSSGGSAPSSRAAGSSSAATTLADRVRAGLSGVTSAHLEIDLGSLGGKSSEDVSIADGKLRASRHTLHTGAGDVQVVTIGAKSYAKLPASQRSGDKPWALVSARSTNPAITKLVGGIDIANATASLDAISGYVSSATSVAPKGSEQVRGAPASRYRLVVDPARLKGDPQLRQMLQLLGSTIPVDLWVDAHDRPVRLAVDTNVSGQHIAIDIEISKYDAPVTITAPPADQIGTG